MGRTEPWSGVIFGQPYSKANSRELVFNKGKLRSIKSAPARAYVKTFLIQCPTLNPMFEGDVVFEATLFYASRRPDLDESLVLDLLQGRIYANDRQVKFKHVGWGLDVENPRAEIKVYPW